MGERLSDARSVVDIELLNSLTISGIEAGTSSLKLKADEGDDVGDNWNLSVADGGVLTINNDIGGTDEAMLTVTPDTNAASSTTSIAGKLAVTGALSAPILKAPVENGNDDLTIKEDLHAGTVIIQTDVAANRTYTLPAPSAAGVIYRFLGQGSGAAADGHSIIITTGTAGVFFDGMITMLMTTTNDNSNDDADNQFNTPVWADGTAHDHLQINVPAGYDITLIAKSTTVYYITGTVTSATAAAFTAP